MSDIDGTGPGTGGEHAGRVPAAPASPSRPGRLGVGIISAGRVGAVLGCALRAVEHQVVGVHAVSEESRERAEMLLPGVPVLEVEEIVERAELVLLAVPDDALGPLVQGLADLGRWQPGQLVAHTSGRYGAAVLAPAQRCGAIPLAIHPAMTFSGFSTDVARLVGCPMAVSAPAAVLPIAQALVVELGGEPFVLEESARPIYHAALAHGANHLLTVVTQAVRVLAAAGVEDGAATLGPLLTAALDRALHEGEAGLTGPVSRGDAGTVAAHLEALSTLSDSQGRGLDDVVRAPDRRAGPPPARDPGPGAPGVTRGLTTRARQAAWRRRRARATGRAARRGPGAAPAG